MPNSSSDRADCFSRRNFLTSTMASTMTVTLLDKARGEPAPDRSRISPRQPLTLSLLVNGQERRLAISLL